MGKLNLKSLKNTVVHTPTEEEFNELMQIYEDAGWKWGNGPRPSDIEYDGDLACINAENNFNRSSLEFCIEYKLTIMALDQFKKIQGLEGGNQMEDIDKIMLDYGVLKPKYSAGDVLVNDSGNKRLVLGVQDYVLYLSDTDDFTVTDGYWTQRELDNRGLKLHTGTPEPTKTKFTMQEIADKIGMGVDSFEIVE